MNKILELNEENQGLKLIQVNDGFVVVDLEANIEKEGIIVYYDGEQLNFPKGCYKVLDDKKEMMGIDGFGIEHFISEEIKNEKKYTNSAYLKIGYNIFRFFDKYTLAKIIFATPNLNLEGVPVIQEKKEYSLEESKKFALSYFDNLKDNYLLGGRVDIQNILDTLIVGVECGHKFGYKQAHQNLYSEEQVRTAMNKILLAKHSDGIIDMDAWISNGYEGAEPMFTQDEVIQSLKQPKVEITFEDSKPIKCVML